jgi:hypothetical protein
MEMADDFLLEKHTENDPVKTLSEARCIAKDLKERNRRLMDEIGMILENNERFAELVILLENKVKTLTEERIKSYKYSFDKGGWVEKAAADREKLSMASHAISIEKINTQLEEILRLIKKHRPDD